MTSVSKEEEKEGPAVSVEEGIRSLGQVPLSTCCPHSLTAGAVFSVAGTAPCSDAVWLQHVLVLQTDTLSGRRALALLEL